MRNLGEIKIFAHIATADFDYEWYEIGTNRCERTGSHWTFLKELAAYRCDQQALLMLSYRSDASPCNDRWMVSIGPVLTAWHDRHFGRPIKLRLVFECSVGETAYHIFRWGLESWWELRRNAQRKSDELLSMHPDEQVTFAAQWLMDNPVRSALQFESQEPLRPSENESLEVQTSSPIHAQFSPARSKELLFMLLHESRKRTISHEKAQSLAMSTPSSMVLAAVSDGFVPSLHCNTLLALGVEPFYPFNWSPHRKLEHKRTTPPSDSYIFISGTTQVIRFVLQSSVHAVSLSCHCISSIGRRILSITPELPHNKRNAFSKKMSSQPNGRKRGQNEGQ